MESGRYPLNALALGLSLCIMEKWMVYNLERCLHPSPLWQPCHPTSLSILLRVHSVSFYPFTLILFISFVCICVCVWCMYVYNYGGGTGMPQLTCEGQGTTLWSQCSPPIFIQITGIKFKLSELSSKNFTILMAPTQPLLLTSVNCTT